MTPRMRIVFTALAGAVLYAAAVTSARADEFIINSGPANTTISTFGYTNTATYGQTITTVAGTTQLDSFSFSIQPFSGSITYRAYVMAWDGAKATGPILFQSGDQVTTAGMNQYTYNTGGLNLASGTQYVLFVSVSNNYLAGNGAGVMAARSDNPYSGGQFVYMNNGGNFGQLTSDTWSSFPTYDLAFNAHFSSSVAETPEPASMLLLGTGITGLMGVARRRRNRQTSS